MRCPLSLMKIDVKSHQPLFFSHDVLPPINSSDRSMEKGYHKNRELFFGSITHHVDTPVPISHKDISQSRVILLPWICLSPILSCLAVAFHLFIITLSTGHYSSSLLFICHFCSKQFSQSK